MDALHFWTDVRYGARTLRNSPAFFATAVVTLALGIGATTAIFSVFDALLWKPAPLPDLDSLVMVVVTNPKEPNEWNSMAPADSADIQREVKTFRRFSSWQGGMANIAGTGGEPERVIQTLVTSTFFDTAGMQPAIGRTFQEGEDSPGREREVILSDRLWKRRFGADAAIAGKTVRLDDQNFTVIGVMPAGFDFPMATDIWTPLALTPEQRASHGYNATVVLARLQPGATAAQASAQVDGIAARLAKAFPETNRNRHFGVWPARRFLVDRETNEYLNMVMGAVLFVLLIACMNVANLQFTRAAGRLREVAVRTALGASRARVVAQLITESVLLSSCGAALGLIIANWGIRAMKNGMPLEVQRYILGWKDIGLDNRTLAFTFAAAVLSGILSGLAPAWQLSKPNLTDALKEGGRGATTGRGRHLLRNILVGAEIALAVVLLVGAGLMVRGFSALLNTGAALEPKTLLTLRLALTNNKYREPHQRAGFYRDVLARISTVPGVNSAAAAISMPYSDHSSGRQFTIEGRPTEPGDMRTAMYQTVSSRFFETLRVPLRSGRFLNAGDGADAPKVAVIGEQLARRWWSKDSPIGKHIKIGGANAKTPWLTIVGVVGDLPHSPYDRQPRRTLYLPFEQAPVLWADLGIRTDGDPLRVASAVTAAIRTVDPEQPVTEMQTMERAIHNRAIGLNYIAVLMGIFGTMALVLSAIGVYGVMAFVVSEQTHEIGIRLALGAPRTGVLAMIFRRGMITALAGLAIGMPAAYGLARLMESLIFGISATDPSTFVGIPLALVAAAALAIYVPARRAMRIDPIVALRYE